MFDTVTNVSRGHSLVSLKAGAGSCWREWETSFRGSLLRASSATSSFRRFLTPPPPLIMIAADSEMKLLPCVATIFPDPIKNHQRAWPAISLLPSFGGCCPLACRFPNVPSSGPPGLEVWPILKRIHFQYWQIYLSIQTNTTGTHFGLRVPSSCCRHVPWSGPPGLEVWLLTNLETNTF